jgi:uncharacterized membrane protein
MERDLRGPLIPSSGPHFFFGLDFPPNARATLAVFDHPIPSYSSAADRVRDTVHAMNTPTLVLVLAFCIGVIAGLRAMTAPAVTCWAAHLGWINLTGSHLAWMASIIAVAIFTLAAIGELINDKLPKTPARTQPPSVVIRCVMGGLSGAALAVAGGAGLLIGAVIGIVGALAGTFGGYQARHQIVGGLKIKDLPIALIEDVIAVGGGLLIVSRL